MHALAFAFAFSLRQVILIVAAMLVLMNVINAIYAVDPRDTLQYALYNLGYSELIILHSLQPRGRRGPLEGRDIRHEPSRWRGPTAKAHRPTPAGGRSARNVHVRCGGVPLI